MLRTSPYYMTKTKVARVSFSYPDNFVDEGFMSSVLKRDCSNKTIRLRGSFFCFETT